jgi:hypothetical protein
MRSRAICIGIVVVAVGFPASSVGASGVAQSSASSSGLAADLPSGINPVPESGVWQTFGALIKSSGALGAYYRMEDGAVVVVVPTSGSSTFRSADATALGISVVVESRDIEPADVAAIKARVAASDWTPPIGVGYPVGVFDARSGRVRIYSDAPKTEFAEVMSEFPDKIDLGPALALTTRMADYEPHWGGARMVSPQAPQPESQWWCTSGFSVLNSNGNPRMVTASHCFKKYWTVDSPQGSTFGTVMRRDNYPSYDFELVGGGGVQQGAIVYTGGASGSYTDVVGAFDANYNSPYCFSGAASYESCELTLIDPDMDPPACFVDYWGVYGCRMDAMLFQGPAGHGACGHDSGAPFYYKNSRGAYINGIVIGGTYYGPESDCPTQSQTVIIQKYSQIHDAYNVTVKLTNP